MKIHNVMLTLSLLLSVGCVVAQENNKNGNKLDDELTRLGIMHKEEKEEEVKKMCSVIEHSESYRKFIASFPALVDCYIINSISYMEAEEAIDQFSTFDSQKFQEIQGSELPARKYYQIQALQGREISKAIIYQQNKFYEHGLGLRVLGNDLYHDCLGHNDESFCSQVTDEAFQIMLERELYEFAKKVMSSRIVVVRNLLDANKRENRSKRDMIEALYNSLGITRHQEKIDSISKDMNTSNTVSEKNNNN